MNFTEEINCQRKLIVAGLSKWDETFVGKKYDEDESTLNLIKHWSFN